MKEQKRAERMELEKVHDKERESKKRKYENLVSQYENKVKNSKYSR